jgi:hypothetical protein
MNNLEQISTIAFGLAVVALFNWLTGDRSFRGSELMIRQGAFWVGCRWFGLGVWLATVVATSQDDFLLESAGLIGAFILLFGTARKTIRHGTRPRKESLDPKQKPTAIKS